MEATRRGRGLCPAQQDTSALPGTPQPSPSARAEPMPGANGAFRSLGEAGEGVRRGGSRCGKAAVGRRAGSARPCRCSRHRDACTGWPSPLPASRKKGSPASWGQGSVSTGQHHPASRLRQRELLQAFLPQPVPGEILAGDHAHHLPGQGQGTAPRWHAQPGDKPGPPAHSEQGLTSLRLSTTTKCRSPRARKSLNTRGSDASCKAERGCVSCGIPSQHPSPTHDPWGVGVRRGPWPLPEAQCRARGS